MTTETDIAWAAGILEGEGSFGMQYNRTCTVAIQMTDLDVLESIQKILGGNVRPIVKRQEHWKDTWSWSLSGSNALLCMKTVLPFMHSRRSTRIIEIIKNREEYEKSVIESKKEHEKFKIHLVSDYENGVGSIRFLANKYNVSRSAAHIWIKQNRIALVT